MLTYVQMMWITARIALRTSRAHDERGSVVETVILTAIFAALAITIGTIIITKVTNKAKQINLN
jgi:hypothetical protein